MDPKKNVPYPGEWHDDQVMDVMFSPFRESRYVNPRSWDSKITFWSDMVRSQCSKDRRLVFNARQLPSMFERNGKMPACLNVVLEHLIKNNTIQPLSAYAAGAGGWVPWSFDVLLRRPVKWSYRTFVSRPLSWAVSKVFGSSEDDTLFQPKSRDQLVSSLPDEDYVMVELVKNAAESIYEQHCSSVTFKLTDEIVGYADLAQRCRDICADDRSFDVAILELCRQKRCTVGVGNSGEKIIRMAEKASVLSDTDLKIYRLKAAETKLEGEIKKVNDDMEQCRINAKTCLQQGRKSAALKFLRRKKLLDGRQVQLEQAIDKITSLLHMLQQTESQKQVLDAYATGVQAFKHIKNRYGLTEESIDDTMNQIHEAFDDNEIINQTISQPLPGDTALDDDDELERELDDLLACKIGTGVPSTPLRPGGVTMNDFDVASLPSVPQHEPGVSPIKNSSTSQPAGSVRSRILLDPNAD